MKNKYPYGRVKDTKSFIKRSIWNFGNLYDYSGVDYKDSKTPVEIRCSVHGVFFMPPWKHIDGRHCPDCAKENSLSALRTNNPKPPKTTAWFVEECRKIHGSKYDYSEVEYTNMHTKVSIICPLHGRFEQEPNSHYRSKAGCPECSGNRSLKQSNQDWFVEKAKDVHGDRYNYKSVDYVNTHTKVTINCQLHGNFEQTPLGHLNGQGCPKCAGRGRSKGEWIELFQGVHGNKFDYSLFEYTSIDDKISIRCPRHGVFEQLISNHLKYKHCCPDCLAEHRREIWNLGEIKNVSHQFYTSDGKAYLYLLKIGSDFIKVGISSNLKARLQQIRREVQGLDIEVIKTVQGKASEIYAFEQDILHKSNIPRMLPEIDFAGKTECFSVDYLDYLKTMFDSLEN